MEELEKSRVRAVEALGIMGTEQEPEFDRIARLAGHVMNADYAQVCFIDAAHQFIKAGEGHDFPRWRPRNESICVDPVLSGQPLIVSDLAQEPRLAFRFAQDAGFTSYVGMPIRLPDGFVVGAVAVMSRGDLAISEKRLTALADCSDLAGREALIRRSTQATDLRAPTRPQRSAAVPDVVRAITTNHLDVLRCVSDGVIVVRSDASINFVNPAAERLLGCSAADLIDRSFTLEVAQAPAAEADKGCPVAASLSDGAERFVRSAQFRHKQRPDFRVGYIVTPIVVGTVTIGAVVIFRPLEMGETSSGVELRKTLREVSRLKDQIARLEAAQRSGTATTSALPPLSTKSLLSLADVLVAIRQEQNNQMARARNVLSDSSGQARLLLEGSIPNADPAPPGFEAKVNSRLHRWGASDQSRSLAQAALSAANEANWQAAPMLAGGGSWLRP